MLSVYRQSGQAPAQPRPSAVTIGNFDGAHLGHQHLFQRVAEVARQRGLVSTVLTFDPHPTRIIAPDRAPRLLSSPEERFHWMEASGIEQVFVIPFDRDFAQLTPQQFVTRILKDLLNAQAVFVGDNFRFGNRQTGDTTTLRQLGAQHGFSTEIVPGVSIRGRLVSSTELRRLIQNGAVSAACRLLGRPFSLTGDVVSGHGIGSRQTVPTLNLKTSAEVLPATGVYVTRTSDLDAPRNWPSITNVGYRPTFNGDDLTVETYLLAPLDEPRPAHIRVDFLRRLRNERKFASPEQLKAQIMKDVARAQTYHRRVEALGRAHHPV